MVERVLGVEQTITIDGGLAWSIVFLFAGAVALLSYKRPHLGAAVVLASLPLYQVRGTVGIPTTLLEVVLWAFLIGALLRLRRVSISRWYAGALAAWLAASLLAVVVSGDIRAGLGLWRAFFLEPALFFVVATTLFEHRSARPILYGSLGALFVTAFWILLTMLQGTAFTYDDRLAGPFQSANFVALLVVPLILIVAFWPKRELLWARITAGAVAAALLAGCQSRGGLIALAAGGAVGIFVGWKALGARLRLGLIGALILIVSTFSVLMVGRDDPHATRKILWEQAAQSIKENPLFADGPAGFQAAVMRRVKDDNYLLQYVAPFAPNPHNIFLVLWVEWGVFTLAAFLLLLGVFLRSLRGSAFPAAAAAAMTAILVHGLVDTPILKNDLALIFATALLLGAIRSERRA